MGAGLPRITPKDISRLRFDTIIGMFFSNLIMFFIIVTAGATLFPQGITHIQSASEAALALRPIGGDYAFWLFAIGIIGTGFLALLFWREARRMRFLKHLGGKKGCIKNLCRPRDFMALFALQH
jgi:Mn2+/Fe2+ NRAMP family transporter